MKKTLLVTGVLVAVGISAGAYYMRRGDKPPQIMTSQVTRGDIVDAVGATGTLEAVTTVQVGTQVSGTVQELYADFNSIVRKGQVIARLDPSLTQTQIEQQQANVARAQAEVERLRVALDDAKVKLQRAEDLSDRSLIPRTELETAEVNVRTAEAQLKSAQAGITQAHANLNQMKVNLDHTVIHAPIDGIVISRNVDVGQTVAASMQAPTLYLLAADLTKMKVNANIDEADVGRIRPGQTVRFRVDAFPTDDFLGTVSQIRLQPTVVQNVVTYATVIDVPNPDLKLKPGMTANVSIEIARKHDVVRVPAMALRFRPTADTFAALGQELSPEVQRGRGAAATAANQRPAASSPRATGTRGGNGGDAQQRREGTATSSGAQSIDQLFGPLPQTETTGRVWQYINNQLKPARVRLGISDGTWTELLGGELRPGTELVTGVMMGQPASPTAGGTRSPLMPQGRQPGGQRNAPSGGAGRR
ncbi:MAG TPA: efflux RND transporter periplasmic adaptor subunit [Vicinamibacterales bacterium]|jgi:HlyD family secretion protein|nr:efflux RND transporter periplasmic adaptor subunit [Vicinamibacterales bacterium]